MLPPDGEQTLYMVMIAGQIARGTAGAAQMAAEDERRRA